MSVIRFLARPMLASSFVVAGLDKLKNVDDTAQQLSPLLRRTSQALPFKTDEKMLARVIGGAQVGAGALLALGKFSRFSATVLALTSALNAYVEWRSADSATTEARTARRSRLLKNLSLGGGVLLAAVDTNGRPSIAWRAEHLAADARKVTGKQFRKADQAVRKAVDTAVGA
ncbi:DoxX family protein [Arthrobacter sp. ISL-30]|uniref:DoxX family protein n=1 Tax=Arthrobacter sp. ISL-30 TaxID=2819109 RepID=UPI001BE95937|nr:DoxX family protein [Arthrobacter sp. ISL-30]MBT2513917.1 DoxX family protein [Arthrobacter sp. ISL-30]